MDRKISIRESFGPSRQRLAQNLGRQIFKNQKMAWSLNSRRYPRQHALRINSMVDELDGDTAGWRRCFAPDT